MRCFKLFDALSLVGMGLSVAYSAPISLVSVIADDAVAVAVAEPVGTPAEKASTSTRPLNVTTELNVGGNISGTLVDADVVDIKTAFGVASIPLSEVAGIRFASGEDVTTTVVMINGDSITGATDVKLVTIETDWGVAKINGSAIQSLLLIPNMKWQASAGLSGKRWSLVDSKATTPGPAGTTGSSGGNPNSRGQSSSSLPAPSSGNNNGPVFLPQGTVIRQGVISQ
jgi:hypothetical protein